MPSIAQLYRDCSQTNAIETVSKIKVTGSVVLSKGNYYAHVKGFCFIRGVIYIGQAKQILMQIVLQVIA